MASALCPADENRLFPGLPDLPGNPVSLRNPPSTDADELGRWFVDERRLWLLCVSGLMFGFLLALRWTDGKIISGGNMFEFLGMWLDFSVPAGDRTITMKYRGLVESFLAIIHIVRRDDIDMVF